MKTYQKNLVIQYYNTTTTKPQRYYTNAHRNISINRINFKVIFDTGASSNTMSKKLADKLHIGIELEHESYSTVANSNKMLKYRYTQKIVTIKKMNIPINFTISDSMSTDVLLGTSFFVATNAKIDYE